MPRWYGQRGRMHAIIGDASLMAAHAGHPPSRGRLRRGSCYESQKPRLVQKGWDMLLQHAMRFRRCQWVSCCRRAARDSPTPSIRPGTLLRASCRRLSFEFFGFRPPHGFVSRNLIYPSTSRISPKRVRSIPPARHVSPKSPGYIPLIWGIYPPDKGSALRIPHTTRGLWVSPPARVLGSNFYLEKQPGPGLQENRPYLILSK